MIEQYIFNRITADTTLQGLLSAGGGKYHLYPDVVPGALTFDRAVTFTVITTNDVFPAVESRTVQFNIFAKKASDRNAIATAMANIFNDDNLQASGGVGVIYSKRTSESSLGYNYDTKIYQSEASYYFKISPTYVEPETSIEAIFAIGIQGMAITSLVTPVIITGEDRLIQVAMWCSATPTSVLCDGVPMTLLMSHNSLSNIRVYYLKAPNLGSVNVTINFAVSSSICGNILLDGGVKQTGGPNVLNNVGLVGSVMASSSTVTPTVDECMVYGVCILNSAVANNPNAGANTVRRAQQSHVVGIDVGTFNSPAPVNPAGATTLNFTSTISANHYNMSWAWEKA